MSIAFLIIGSLYALVLLVLFVGNLRLKKFKSFSEANQTVPIETATFTVVIPFRNEQHRILKLLQSINGLKFPKNSFEVLFVDDDSSDNSVSLITETIDPTIDFQILKNKKVSKSPKKDAITLAIAHAKFDWIITTDADCDLPQNWLNIYAHFIEAENPSLICGAVQYANDGSFIHAFQQLDALSLQWAGMGSFGLSKPILANGANMAYRKDVFFDVNGFVGNNTIASGDDIFMLEKTKRRNPKSVKFLKNKKAIVATQPENSWANVINQRVRWASKTSKINNPFSKGIGILVFMANALLIVGIFWSLFNPTILWYVLIYFILKLILDAGVLYQSAAFFGVRVGFISVVKSALVYPLLTVVVVIKSMSGNYNWKGRDF